jgi:predicted SAM-dependent methyltransferase
MKKIYTNLTQIDNKTDSKNKIWYVKGAFFSVWYWLIAHLYSAPGLNFHLQISYLGLRLFIKSKANLSDAFRLMFAPMDSVRYFEFDYMWDAIKSNSTGGKYLDISSPRLFPFLLLTRNAFKNIEMVNPDINDLNESIRLARMLDLESRCRFHNALIENINFDEASYNAISCISVIEHIPDFGDQEAVRKMWALLKIGGSLLISVPCANKAFEEYINFNEYGLLEAGDNNFTFGQRIYDQQLLFERIYSITGEPADYKIYGEKKCGTFLNNRESKFSRSNYEFWREPFMMSRDYRFFETIEEMPGWGVISMRFVKS